MRRYPIMFIRKLPIIYKKRAFFLKLSNILINNKHNIDLRFSASRQHIFSGCPVSGLCTASSSPFPQQQWAVSPVVTSVVSWPQSSPGAHCCHSWTEERAAASTPTK